MPLKGSFDWSEKTDSLIVTVPLKGVAPAKVDILATKSTLKINYAPYIIDIILFAQIDPTLHKAKVKDGNLIVTLKKLTAGLRWGSLTKSDLAPDEIQSLKADSLKEHEAEQADMAEKRKDRRIEDERFALRRQMALDAGERNRLDDLKAEEKKQAEEEVYKTFDQLEQQQRQKAAHQQQPKSVSFAGSTTSDASSRDSMVSAAMHASASATAAAPEATAPTPAMGKHSNDIFDEDDYDKVPAHTGRGDFDSDLEDEAADRELMDGMLNDKLQQQQGQQAVEEDNVVEDDEVPVYIPPPRNMANANASGREGGSSGGGSNVVPIEFTPRIFPTPMRESTLAQEEDWIAKNRKHLKKHGVFGPNHSKNLTRLGRSTGGGSSGGGGNISEEDPVWLKAKGDEYCRHGDYMSAINAYSTALDLDDSMASCYANRSVCYFASGMFMDCIEDCDDAIKMLCGDGEEITGTGRGGSGSGTANSGGVVVDISAVQNNQMVVKLSMRKAAAQCHMGRYADSLAAYENALTYQNAVCLYHKDNASKDASAEAAAASATQVQRNIEADITKLKLLTRAEDLKVKGDGHIANGEVPEAIAMYDAALELIPIFVSCLSNRSACKLSQGDIQGCIDDCSAAISLLQSDGKSTTAGSAAAAGAAAGGGITLGSSRQHPQASMLSAILPPAGSDKRTQWLLKTVVRRGAAYFQAHQVDAAIADYGLAVSLDQKNAALQKDLTKMMNTRAAMVQAPESIGLPAKAAEKADSVAAAAASGSSPLPPAPPVEQ